MILFIDCYDSFSYNLTRLVSTACDDVPITVCHHDQLDQAELRRVLPSVQAIILGPGPGDPAKPEDNGVLPELLDLVLHATSVPVLGVCLGYQSLVQAMGGTVTRMNPPRHGQVSRIRHDGSAMFEGIPQDFEAVRYHSLCTVASESLRLSATAVNDSAEMAVYHPMLPLWAVQYHPESVLSQYGQQLIANFWRMATQFNRSQRVMEAGTIPRSLTVTYDPLLKSSEPSAMFPDVQKSDQYFTWLEIGSILDDFVLLNSSAMPGKWSIFGVLENGVTPHIRSKGGRIYEGPLRSAPLIEKSGNIWAHVADFMGPRLLSKNDRQQNVHDLPFLGGLVGYITYEGGCEHTICSDMPKSDSNSDVSFVFTEKVILVDEVAKETYFIGQLPWIQETRSKLKIGVSEYGKKANDRSQHNLTKKRFSRPSADEYQSMVAKCFEPMHAGDSYELCMTCQAELEFSAPAPTPWELFQELVKVNPAPYCGYMTFDDCLVATSPERFMAWNDKKCEFRPIKGTVRKTPGMTLERATEILRTPKEQGENLMIVDLIRHDLGHLLNNVTCPQLMTVEEYASVYQLVTSVEGTFEKESAISGFDVLTQSLPPGSMTGAPKKRSVEILSQLEKTPRGLYSGVQGYWSINDTGDWSVVIRSLFKYANDPPDLWRLGAGGAVTVLSSPKGEYDEMCTKMDSVLKIF